MTFVFLAAALLWQKAPLLVAPDGFDKVFAPLRGGNFALVREDPAMTTVEIFDYSGKLIEKNDVGKNVLVTGIFEGALKLVYYPPNWFPEDSDSSNDFPDLPLSIGIPRWIGDFSFTRVGEKYAFWTGHVLPSFIKVPSNVLKVGDPKMGTPANLVLVDKQGKSGIVLAQFFVSYGEGTPSARMAFSMAYSPEVHKLLFFAGQSLYAIDVYRK